jgi:hypothetical protein
VKRLVRAFLLLLDERAQLPPAHTYALVSAPHHTWRGL